MQDALDHGRRFRAFNVLDDFNREAIRIEIDTSLRAARLIQVFEQLKHTRGLPKRIRVDNGPEFISHEWQQLCQAHRIKIDYIQPGQPNQNAYIERFNRSYRNEVLNLYLFRNLEEVREITRRWIHDYNQRRPHDALGGLPPLVYLRNNDEPSNLELCA